MGQSYAPKEIPQGSNRGNSSDGVGRPAPRIFPQKASSNSKDYPGLINEPQVRPHFDVTGDLLHKYGQGRESVKRQGYLKNRLRVKYS